MFRRSALALGSAIYVVLASGAGNGFGDWMDNETVLVGLLEDHAKEPPDFRARRLAA